MVDDDVRTAPQLETKPGTNGVALPRPRPPVLDAAADDTVRPVRQPAAQNPSASVRGSRAGWIVTTVVAAAAAWAVGWVAGVSWAWREMTPGFLSRTHRRRGAGMGALAVRS